MIVDSTGIGVGVAVAGGLSAGGADFGGVASRVAGCDVVDVELGDAELEDVEPVDVSWLSLVAGLVSVVVEPAVVVCSAGVDEVPVVPGVPKVGDSPLPAVLFVPESVAASCAVLPV